MTSVTDHLRALADRLTGASWETTFPAAWTPAQADAYREELAARGIADVDWLADLMDQPYEVDVLDHWRCGDYSFRRERVRLGRMEREDIRLVSWPSLFGIVDPENRGPYERCIRRPKVAPDDAVAAL